MLSLVGFLATRLPLLLYKELAHGRKLKPHRPAASHTDDTVLKESVFVLGGV